MDTLIIGKKIIELKEVDSTNSFLQRMLADSATYEGLIVRADSQTSGRGMGVNNWRSEPGKNLLFSLLLKPNSSVDDLYFLNKAIAVSLCQALNSIEIDAKIKWPNDIYVKDKKIAGILIENRVKKSRLNNAIIGIGLNVNQVCFSADLNNPISIKLLSRNHLEVLDVLKLVSKFLEVNYLKFKRADFSSIDSLYHSYLSYKDEKRLFVIDGKTKEATIKKVNNLGQLILTMNDQTHAFSHSEIKFVI